MDVHPVISGGYGQQKRWGTTYDIINKPRGKGKKSKQKWGFQRYSAQ